MKLEDSIKDGAHAALARLVGKWKGEAKTWFGTELADQSPVTGSMKPILGGRFIWHAYTGSFQGKPTEGVAIYGYDLSKGKYQSAWMDSFHMSTGIMFSEGSGENFSVLGHYEVSQPEQQRWGWRTELDVVSSDKIIITMYNISPQGEEWKATEMVYERA